MQLGNLQSVQKADTELEKTEKYITRNIVRAHEGRKCVDGRYLPSQASGMIARPGGDCGYVVSLLAVNKKKGLGLTPEQCFNAVYKVVSRGRNHHFCMHTDHHCDPDTHTHNGLIGCGHLIKAASADLSAEYDVDSQDVRRFVEYARNVANIIPKLEMVNLEGEHAEMGVLVVHSKKYTVNSEDLDLKQMYFIYDKERDEEYLRDLVSEIGIAGVSFEEMKKESDLQLAATLHNLAKGLPVYDVSFRGKIPDVRFASFVK